MMSNLNLYCRLFNWRDVDHLEISLGNHTFLKLVVQLQSLKWYSILRFKQLGVLEFQNKTSLPENFQPSFCILVNHVYLSILF